MKLKYLMIAAAMWIFCWVPAKAGAADLSGATDRDWDVDGDKRTGIICMPDSTVNHQPAAGWPVVFVFHGHGGSARQIRRQYKVDTLWPEAVVVYLQGLPTVGKLTDKDGEKSGWELGDGTNSKGGKNRDLRLYDVVLKDLIDHQHIDPKRVMVAGHSNGGGFVFTLWAYRGDTIAAVAASSSVAGPKVADLFKPKPAMMTSGRNDPLVKFEWQSKMMDRLKTIDNITTDGKSWGTDGTWYASGKVAGPSAGSVNSAGKAPAKGSENADEVGTPLATIIYDGGHAPPADIGKRVVDFFKVVAPEDRKAK